MVLPNFDAAVNAIKKRILADYSTGYSEQQLLDNWDLVYKMLDSTGTLAYFPESCEGLHEGLTTDEWFERWVTRFPGPSQRQLRAARLELVEKPLCRSDFSVQVITKIEKSGFIDVDWPRKDARAVNNCTPRRNAALGPQSWAYAKALMQTFGGDGKWAMWTPGRTSEEVGAFFDDAVRIFSSRPGTRVKYWSGDQSAFDAHQNKGSVTFETKIYRRAGCKTLADSCLESSVPFGSHQKYNIKFNAGKCARVSGDGKTSSGNVSVSFAAVCYALGPPGEQSWAGLFNGDDFLIITSEEFSCRFESIVHIKFAELGLEAEILFTCHEKDLEFCQTIPYPTSDGTIFAPKIGRLMSRLGVSTSFSDPTMKSIAMGLYVTCHHVPFVHHLLLKYLILTQNEPDVYVKNYKFHPQLNNFATRPHDMNGATWEFVYDRYGLTVEHLAQFLLVLDSISVLPSVAEWPIINSLVEIDE